MRAGQAGYAGGVTMQGVLYAWALRRFTPDGFANVRFNPKLHDRIMSRPAATRRYAMFFTPRSGSSRVTDLADKTGVLSRPVEQFNAEFLPGMAQALSAADLPDYVELLTRHFNRRGTFGCQLTYAHLVRIFGDEARFLDLVRPDSHIWLIRKDIVAQAVSVSRMVQTSVSHAPDTSPEDLERANRDFVYRPLQIAGIIWRLRWLEQSTEAMFARHRIEPLRVSYEYLAETPPRIFLSRIGAHVGAAEVPAIEPESDHRKIAGPKNDEFAARFRAAWPRLMARLDTARAPMLERLEEP